MPATASPSPARRIPGTVTRLAVAPAGECASIRVQYTMPNGAVRWVEFDASRPWPARGTMCVVSVEDGDEGPVVTQVELDQDDLVVVRAEGPAEARRTVQALLWVIGGTVVLVLLFAAVIGLWIAAGPADSPRVRAP